MTETTGLNLLDELEKYLEFERECGVERLEVDRAVLAELATDASAPVVEAPVQGAHLTEGRPVALDSVEAIAKAVSACTKCPLVQGRINAVPGEGHAEEPDILFVGEGPGAEEDAQGRPFVGRAGRLLDQMIAAMGYVREEVFIANVVKCRPPGNRKPTHEEMKQCRPYLQRLIALIRPKVIVGLGGTAMEGLLGKPVAITRKRGIWTEVDGTRLMPTYHPAYLLRAPSRKKEAWNDLQTVMAALGKTNP